MSAKKMNPEERAKIVLQYLQERGTNSTKERIMQDLQLKRWAINQALRFLRKDGSVAVRRQRCLHMGKTGTVTEFHKKYWYARPSSWG